MKPGGGGGWQALTRCLTMWTKPEVATLPDGWARNVLDLACGSGEATLAIQSFLERGRQPTTAAAAAAESPAAAESSAAGVGADRVEARAERAVASEDNESRLMDELVDGTRLDGADERAQRVEAVGDDKGASSTREEEDRGYRLSAIDPFTYAAFQQRTGLPCEQLSFEDVEAGCLLDGREAYSVRRAEDVPYHTARHRVSAEAQRCLLGGCWGQRACERPSAVP
jgi:SAM-dependent methyltransferase